LIKKHENLYEYVNLAIIPCRSTKANGKTQFAFGETVLPEPMFYFQDGFNMHTKRYMHEMIYPIRLVPNQ